jgi:hypothetical protein
MIHSGRILSYGLLITMLMLLVGGGVGAVLPSIFNWDSDLMFVALPVVALLIFTMCFAIVRCIARMVRTDVAKLNQE